MRTILIAQRDTAFAEHLTTELRAAGYHVIDCPGPWPPAERCIRCDKGYCPLSEAADLMIYDPTMTALDSTGHRYNLAIDSARAEPDVPMLLDWPASEPVDAGLLRSIHDAAPTAHVAARSPASLLAQIAELLAP